MTGAFKRWCLSLVGLTIAAQIAFAAAVIFAIALSSSKFYWASPYKNALAFCFIGAFEIGLYVVQTILPGCIFAIVAILLLRRRNIQAWTLAIAMVASASLLGCYARDALTEPYPYIVYGDTSPYQPGLTAGRFVVAALAHMLILVGALILEPLRSSSKPPWRREN